jgi:replicative DNA helicase
MPEARRRMTRIEVQEVSVPASQAVSGRMPPQNLDAEISTLGALLLDTDAIMKVADVLHPEDFYRPDHGQIYTAMVGLFEKRTPIDLVTVAGELERTKALDDIGGMAKLSSLVSSVATAANIAHYATIVREKALLRRLIGAAGTIGELGWQEEMEVDELLDTAERTLFGVTQRFLKQNFLSVRTILDDSFERLGMLAKQDGALRGIPTGFRQLDRLLGGLQRSDLLIIAARPSMGKTAFMMNIAEHISVLEKKTVGIFSLEMSKEQLVDRLISSMGRVDSWKLRNGQLSEDDMSNLIQAQAQLAEANLFIDDAPMATVMEVRAKARRLQAEHGLDLICIDYLQLMQGSSRHQDNRVQEVSEISRSLKALAKELNCPVIALSQLSRAVEARNDKRPMLSDLRESGSIEQDADVVMFLYRDDYYNKNREEHSNTLEVIVSKHRNGPTGDAKLSAQLQHSRFYDIDLRHQDGA